MKLHAPTIGRLPRRSSSACAYRRGYALVLTLVLLVIAAAAATAVARRVNDRSLQVARAQESLQQRWGELTCPRFLTPLAPEALAIAEAEAAEPVAAVSRSFDLNGISITAVFTDEQARVNINALYDAADRYGTASALEDLHADALRTAPRVTLRPVKQLEVTPPENVSDQAQGEPIRFRGLGQIYEEPLPDDAAAVLPVTCWGDGRLNILRAPEDAIAVALGGPHLGTDALGPGEIDRLVRLRAEQPGVRLGALLSQLGLEQNQRAAILNRATDRSNTHAAWYVIETGSRSWRTVSVQSSNSDGQRGMEVQRW